MGGNLLNLTRARPSTTTTSTSVIASRPQAAVTEADIVNFAGLSGDFNSVHVDAEFARLPRTANASPCLLVLARIRLVYTAAW
jgi:acyl dehydratase